MDGLNNLEPHYAWLAIGLILAAAEMAVPGVFLIWMAGAALIVGARLKIAGHDGTVLLVEPAA